MVERQLKVSWACGPRLEASRATRRSKPDSGVLGKNLGDKLNAGDHAHHIVAGRLASAEEARKLLDRYHIDINAETNGVGLPGLEHLKPRWLHDTEGQKAVTDRLTAAIKGITDWGKARQKIIEELELIGEEIKRGIFRQPS